jgi:hypothetical protein
VRTGTSPSRVSNGAQSPIFIDSSEVKQYVTAPWRAISMMSPKLHILAYVNSPLHACSPFP